MQDEAGNRLLGRATAEDAFSSRNPLRPSRRVQRLGEGGCRV